MKVVVAGAGYVGLSNAILLSQNHEVVLLDINPTRVTQINNKVSPIQDEKVQDFLEKQQLNLFATSNNKQTYERFKEYKLLTIPQIFEINRYFSGP